MPFCVLFFTGTFFTCTFITVLFLPVLFFTCTFFTAYRLAHYACKTELVNLCQILRYSKNILDFAISPHKVDWKKIIAASLMLQGKMYTVSGGRNQYLFVQQLVVEAQATGDVLVTTVRSSVLVVWTSTGTKGTVLFIDALNSFYFRSSDRSFMGWTHGTISRSNHRTMSERSYHGATSRSWSSTSQNA